MTYSRILVAMDLSDAADKVAQRALHIGPSAEITATHVIDLPPYVGEHVAFRPEVALREHAKSQAAKRLEAACAPAGIERRVLLEGHPAREICRHAEAHGADLVVMGAHGRRGWRRLLGSTARAVVHRKVCDVLCVHIPEEPQPFRHVLAAVDATEDAHAVLERAVAVASISGARVSVTTVVQPIDYTYASADLASNPATSFDAAVRVQMQARLDELATRFSLTGERLVLTGHPADEIHALTDELEADLVVVGTHGRHGLRLLLGSTANAVLQGAKSDVLAVVMPS